MGGVLEMSKKSSITGLERIDCSCGGWADSIFGKCNSCGKPAMLC